MIWVGLLSLQGWQIINQYDLQLDSYKRYLECTLSIYPWRQLWFSCGYLFHEIPGIIVEKNIYLYKYRKHWTIIYINTGAPLGRGASRGKVKGATAPPPTIFWGSFPPPLIYENAPWCTVYTYKIIARKDHFLWNPL